jgi:NADH-quinone oxidoreductase subunit B
MGELRAPPPAGDAAGAITTRAAEVIAWAQKYSLFMYPFVTACCAMEFMAVTGPRFDFSRFGAEAPRFSPRQSDLLWVVGTITQRQAPVLKRIYEQMAEPKWVARLRPSLPWALLRHYPRGRGSTESSLFTSTCPLPPRRRRCLDA